MRRTRRPLLTMACLIVSAAAASSCVSRDRILVGSPPAEALHADPEPPYPVAALQPGDAGDKAERSWNDDVLTWGRSLKLQIDRLCRWTQHASSGKIPLDCAPAPAAPKVQ